MRRFDTVVEIKFDTFTLNKNFAIMSNKTTICKDLLENIIDRIYTYVNETEIAEDSKTGVYQKIIGLEIKDIDILSIKINGV